MDVLINKVRTCFGELEVILSTKSVNFTEESFDLTPLKNFEKFCSHYQFASTDSFAVYACFFFSSFFSVFFNNFFGDVPYEREIHRNRVEFIKTNFDSVFSESLIHYLQTCDGNKLIELFSSLLIKLNILINKTNEHLKGIMVKEEMMKNG